MINKITPICILDFTVGKLDTNQIFQINQNLPFLYPVDITSSEYEAIEDFNQYLNHYHCATVGLFDDATNQMHNLFFGGMSQYYYADDDLIQDNGVPFVKTIGRVSRDAQGVLTEDVLPIEMPDLLGTAAEFVINEALEQPVKDVISIANIQEDSVLLGYIFGGIHSNGLNPFNQNNSGITCASTTAFKVWIARDEMVNTESLLNGYHDFSIEINPNPVSNHLFQVEIAAPESGSIALLLSDIEGQLLMDQFMEGVSAGKNTIEIALEPHVKGVLFLTILLNGKYSQTKKIIVPSVASI